MNQTQPRNESLHNHEHTSHHRLIRAGVASLLLLAAAAAALLFRQQLFDQYVVWTFKPSASVVSAADRAGLNDTGKFFLYASQTEIVDRTMFNSACGSLQNEQTVVLGCYTSPGQRIYVYDVTDSRLDGVVEATAAHEMLHAAYDRLGSDDKAKVNALLEAQESKITDPRLLKLIAAYKKTEPGELINELHSIIGTEVQSISPELETYYARYFTDRSAVVALTQKYEHVFTDLENQQNALVKELDTLAADINARQTVYNADLKQLNKDIETFNTWTKSGNATAEEYDARKSVLEQRIAALEAERTSINAEITTYNSKKAELDKLNLAAQDLNQSINSKVSPTPSL